MKDAIITRQGSILTSVDLNPKPPVMIQTDSAFSEKYDLMEELGKGMFGVVQKCRCKETGAFYAAKIVRKTAKNKEEMTREVHMMNQLHHQRLAQIYDAYEMSRKLVIVMELINGKELFEKVIQDDNLLTETQCVHYLRQILNGVDHMHKKSIVHLDLKPENILCIDTSKPGYDEIKLIDFGLARELKKGNQLSVICGTPEFVAPEVIAFEPISTQSDMWSIGVITYVLLSGISPFLGEDDSETLQNVTTGEFDFEDEEDEKVFENISDDAKSFISDLLVSNPQKRMSVEDCLNHPWINAKTHHTEAIDTTNLKRFVARRRWLRTITAIKAVGRFSAFKKSTRLGDTMLAALNAKNKQELTETPSERSNEITEILDSRQSTTKTSEIIKTEEIPKSPKENENNISFFSADEGVSDELKKRAERRRRSREGEDLKDNGIFENCNGSSTEIVETKNKEEEEKVTQDNEDIDNTTSNVQTEKEEMKPRCSENEMVTSSTAKNDSIKDWNNNVGKMSENNSSKGKKSPKFSIRNSKVNVKGMINTFQ